jgi:hypothetical protein
LPVPELLTQRFHLLRRKEITVDKREQLAFFRQFFCKGLSFLLADLQARRYPGELPGLPVPRHRSQQYLLWVAAVQRLEPA